MRKDRYRCASRTKQAQNFYLVLFKTRNRLKKPKESSCNLEDYLTPKSTLDIQKKLTPKMLKNLKDFMIWEKMLIK